MDMGLFIIGLVISMIFLIACIFLHLKLIKEKKEIEKIIPFDRTERRNRGNRIEKKIIIPCCFQLPVLFFNICNDMDVIKRSSRANHLSIG